MGVIAGGFMRIAGLLLVVGLAGCSSPATLQTVVHVTTYKDGQTDIIRKDLLFRGKLGPDTVKETLKKYGLREDKTIIKED